ncbi:MAG TPA: DUF1569 domain-containing protein [Longimicrobium sp.]|jgi:hypothetical protein|uniref:DUF1569 domain-containing protein n=1 Tax=Longimicrobium sp. TaxID=2029185 RepID=UPI002ED7FB20
MKNLFEPAAAAEVKARLLKLRPDSARLWGTMNAAQAVAHGAIGMEAAVGDTRPKRMFIGRIIGPVVKRLAIGNDQPIRRNTPTSPDLVVADERELESERQRLAGLIDRFAAAGPAGCTTHPHSFFGRLAPREWAVLMYKHLDHHLRQFGA